MPSTILIIEGDKVVDKPIIALDYPDIVVDNIGVTVIKSGDFGPARKEIVEATGRVNLNLRHCDPPRTDQALTVNVCIG